MRFALLGADDQMLALVRAAAASGEHSIVLAAALGPHETEIRSLAPEAAISSDWVEAVDFEGIDAVLLAADKPTAQVEHLRLIIQLQMPVLVSHPVSLSMLECYELDMIRRETKSVVLPYLPSRWHPAIESLKEAMDAGSGQVEQVSLERFVDDRSRDTVLQHFARDVDLLQVVAGQATKLHAHGSATGSRGGEPYANLAVQMTCSDGLVARWAVSPVDDERGARLTMLGSAGKTSLWMPDAGTVWRLETRRAGQPTMQDFQGWDPAVTAIDRLAEAIVGEPVDPTWADAARTVELAETIDISLRRGRTIDLHREDFTDIGTFKGTMASVGCGLLMAGLGVVVLAAIGESIAMHAGWQGAAEILGKWPYLLLFVLGSFLLTQLFLLVGSSGKTAGSENDPSDDRDSATSLSAGPRRG